MKSQDFDPLAYIENAFLDTRTGVAEGPAGSLDVALPSFRDYLAAPLVDEKAATTSVSRRPRGRFRKTEMSAPRPRRASDQGDGPPLDPQLREVWENLPKSLAFLCRFHDDSVTANYYRDGFKETRQELIRRLLDPELTLEETSRLLGVCPATVRRYTNRGWLDCHRTEGGQRRFRLSGVVRFVEVHGRFPEGNETKES